MPETREQIIEQMADCILVHVVEGGREGLIVTASDREGYAYSDCLTAATFALPVAVKAVTDRMRALLPGEFLRTQRGCVSSCQWLIEANDLRRLLDQIVTELGADS